jgi:outer membrane lipoprotein SlyB
MIPLSTFPKFGLAFVALAALTGCAPDYSPNTYNASAMQQANKVDTAVIVGFRQVSISAAGTVGAVTGGAAGGILGSQLGPSSTSSALGAVGGGIVGSLLGTGIEHATADTTGWEYIVQKPNGDLLSVTQREPEPLPLGQKVLVIAGSQARIIPDFRPDPPKDERPKNKPDDKPKPPAEPVVLPPAATTVEPLPPPANISAPPTPAPSSSPAPAEATAPPTPLVPATPPAAAEAPPKSEEDGLPPELLQ